MNRKLKFPILLVTGIITAICAYLMWTMPLWGRIPLLFFIAGWTFKVVAGESRFSKIPQKNKLLLLSTLSGLLLGIGFPVSPFTFLLFVAFVPLLIIEEEITEWREEASKWEVFKYSYNTFVIWNILSTYWVANTAYIASFVAIGLNSLFMTIPIMLYHQAGKVLPGKFRWFALAAYWITFEFLHMRWELTWPWLTLGNGFAEWPSLVQWYEFTGAYGGTLWILLANAVCFEIYKLYKKESSFHLPAVGKLAALILIPSIISLGMYFTYDDSNQKTANVAVIQPNYEPHYEKFNTPDRVVADQFVKLSKQVIDENTDFLVFPETSVGSVNLGALKSNRSLRTFREIINDYPKIGLVTGVGGYQMYRNGEVAPAEARTNIRKNGDTLRYTVYNAAIQLKSGQDEIPTYKKSKLVPGAEIFPYHKLFFFVKPLIDKLGGSMGHGTQPQRSVFTNGETRSAPVICYESIFGEYFTGYIKKGANLAFVVTNDGWWDDTAGHKQHMKFASLRAIETRRDIARSANTGISCFINQRGDIRQKTKYNEEAAIKGTMRLNDEITFYVRWGDLIGRVSLFVAILFFLNTIVKTIIGRRM